MFASAGLNNPVAMAYGDGRLFVLNAGTSIPGTASITAFDPSGNWTTFSTAGLGAPVALGYGGGELYALNNSSVYGGSITRYDPYGNASLLAGGNSVNNPLSIAVATVPEPSTFTLAALAATALLAPRRMPVSFVHPR